MTDVGRLDPVRRKMLEDMGIDVWLLREPADQKPPGVEGALDAVESKVADSIPIASAQPQRPPDHPRAVTCLVSRLAVLLVDNTEHGVSRRLCNDLLAAVTGEWNNSSKAGGPREIAFAWPADRTRAECQRAFKAFAEKQLGESGVRVVLCSQTLVEQLPELAAGCELLVLPEFSELGIDVKRALWRRMQALRT